MVPPAMDHEYVAPAVVGTLAVFPVEPMHTEEGTGVIVWGGIALMVTVAFWPPALPQPPAEVTTQFNVTALPVPAV
jgi:hypothetical protein